MGSPFILLVHVINLNYLILRFAPLLSNSVLPHIYLYGDFVIIYGQISTLGAWMRWAAPLSSTIWTRLTPYLY